jgi:hypothetical protein
LIDHRRVTVVPPELSHALRRIRLTSAVALAEQQGQLDAAAVGRLQAELAHLVDDYATHRGGPRLSALVSRLELRAIDELALLTAVALELDPLFAITAAALAGSEPRTGMTTRLFALVMRTAGDEALELQIDVDHPLVRVGVLEIVADATVARTLAAWRVTTRSLQYLCGSDELDPALQRCGALLVAPPEADFAYAASTVALLTRAFTDGDDVVIGIDGPDGVGRRSIVATVAATVGKQVVALDAARASKEPAQFRAELRALKHECWLRQAFPLVACVDQLAEACLPLLDTLLDGSVLSGPKLVTGASGTQLPHLDTRVLRTRVDPPGGPARIVIWRRALGGTEQPDAVTKAIQHYSLTPGTIHRAAANSLMLARSAPLDAAMIRAGVAAEVQERFGELARRVSVTQTWNDLVLPTDTLDDIKAFVSRASHTGVVYDTWGFRDKLQRGLGLAALFSGPPGTGKTMVAGLIANDLDLDLYQVDLSQVVSKWVGETEKQLGRIFDAASMGHALLLFDEADALFAKRTEVKSSNDRYANLEVNYLLQRIEAFDGVAILTTNLETSVDPALKRRLAIEIPFYPPEVAERERLWQAMLPASAPRGDDLNFAALAQGFDDLCGGNIRNAVLRAAFLAAAEGKPIRQTHLLRAARSEYRALGKVGA